MKNLKMSKISTKNILKKIFKTKPRKKSEKKSYCYKSSKAKKTVKAKIKKVKKVVTKKTTKVSKKITPKTIKTKKVVKVC